MTPTERGLLTDLIEARALSTGQVRRLRFPATTAANCRLYLARLRGRRWIAPLPCRLRPSGQQVWFVTAEGVAALGAFGPARPPLDAGVTHAPTPSVVRAIVDAGERFVTRKLEERLTLPSTRGHTSVDRLLPHGAAQAPGGAMP